MFLISFPWEIRSFLRHQGFFVRPFSLTARRTSKGRAHKVTASTHFHSPFLPSPCRRKCPVPSLKHTPVLFFLYPEFVKLHFYSWIPSVILLTSPPWYFNYSLSLWGTGSVSRAPGWMRSPGSGSLPLWALRVLIAAGFLSWCFAD